MKGFRIIFGYPFGLRSLTVYNPIAYFINDSIFFFDQYIVIDIGDIGGTFKVPYNNIVSFAKIGKHSLELTFDKKTFQKMNKFMDKSIREINSIYFSSWKIASIISLLEKHKIKRLKND